MNNTFTCVHNARVKLCRTSRQCSLSFISIILGRPMGGRLKQNIQDNIAVGLKRFPRQQFLYGYYGNPLYRRLDEPIGTIPTVDTWALITPGEGALKIRYIECFQFRKSRRVWGSLQRTISTAQRDSKNGCLEMPCARL